MNKKSKPLILILLFLVMAGLPIAVHSGQTGNPSARSETAQTEPRPLAKEMLTHGSAFSAIVTAVALSDRAKVHEAIKTMFGTLDKTLEGVRAGTVTFPKNSAQTKEFIEMDLKFRDKLEALDRAALHGNQREMQRITNLLLSACVNCHQAFRK